MRYFGLLEEPGCLASTRFLFCDLHICWSAVFSVFGRQQDSESSHLLYREHQHTNTHFCCRNLPGGGVVFRDACPVNISSFTGQSWWSLCWLLLSPAASPCKLLFGELSPPHSLTLQGGQLLFSISRQDVSLVPTCDCSTTHSQLYSGSIASKQMAQTVSLVWRSSHIGSSYSGTTADHSSYASVHPAKPCVHC